jgi:hypothetical protein
MIWRAAITRPSGHEFDPSFGQVYLQLNIFSGSVHCIFCMVSLNKTSDSSERFTLPKQCVQPPRSRWASACLAHTRSTTWGCHFCWLEPLVMFRATPRRRLSLATSSRMKRAPRPRPVLTVWMGIHRSLVRGRTCTRSGVRLLDTDTRVAPPHVLLDGDPSQNVAQTAFWFGVALTVRYLQAEDSANLAPHPFQTLAAHLCCRRPPAVTFGTLSEDPTRAIASGRTS